MLDAKVYRLEMKSPDDVSGLKKLLDSGELNAKEILAVMGKTEGNGCVNDFTRGYSTMAFKKLLSQYLGVSEAEVEKNVAFVMSGGTEGVMTPHATVFAQSEIPGQPDIPGLSIGVAFTRDFLPEELGTMVQVEEVAKAVSEAMFNAKVDQFGDVHFVQIKCPLLTSDRINDALARGKEVAVNDTYKSMGYSRAASALGIAMALGEVQKDQLNNHVIAHDWSLSSA
ncbi:MAG: ring-opening amidohydrolase, partial [Methanobacteriaceae archaeon]|nr:ring-opening amidohydrolase [Methanobacteriaceae archaeon]